MNLNKFLLLCAACCLAAPAAADATGSASADPVENLEVTADAVTFSEAHNADFPGAVPDQPDAMPDQEATELVMNSYLEAYPESTIGSIFGGYKNCSNHKWEEALQNGHKLVIFTCDLPLQFVEASDLPSVIRDQLNAPDFHGTLQAVFETAAADADIAAPVLSLGYQQDFQPLNPAKTEMAMETITSQQDFYAELPEFTKYAKFRAALRNVLADYFYSLGVSLPADYRHWYHLNNAFARIDLDNFKWERPGQGTLQLTLHETSLKDSGISAHLEKQHMDPSGLDALDMLNRQAPELSGLDFADTGTRTLHYGFSMNAEFIAMVTDRIVSGQRSGALSLHPLDAAPGEIEFQLTWNLHKTMLELEQLYHSQAVLKAAALVPVPAPADTVPAPADTAPVPAGP